MLVISKFNLPAFVAKKTRKWTIEVEKDLGSFDDNDHETSSLINQAIKASYRPIESDSLIDNLIGGGVVQFTKQSAAIKFFRLLNKIVALRTNRIKITLYDKLGNHVIDSE